MTTEIFKKRIDRKTYIVSSLLIVLMATFFNELITVSDLYDATFYMSFAVFLLALSFLCILFRYNDINGGEVKVVKTLFLIVLSCIPFLCLVAWGFLALSKGKFGKNG